MVRRGPKIGVEWQRVERRGGAVMTAGVRDLKAKEIQVNLPNDAGVITHPNEHPGPANQVVL